MILLGIDPALSNLGMAKFEYDPATGLFRLLDLRLVKTEASKEKQTRKSSDDYERAKLLHAGLRDYAQGCHLAFAELPIGSQSARAMASYGMSVMLIASCPIVTIPVNPAEAKMAGPGVKTATKHEMIEWAMKKHPDGPWIIKKNRGVMKPTDDNEHLADACAIVEAGIKTKEFQFLSRFASHES